MNNNIAPSIETHIPLKVEDLPAEPNELAVGRPDLPTPSLWQRSVMVRHKVTNRLAVVQRVDYATNQFRAYYPDEGEVNPETGRAAGRFAERTEWEQCRDWHVEVTFSPRELERQRARQDLDAEMAKLDPNEMAAVLVLCDDADPSKALAKLEALRRLGVVKGSATASLVAEAKAQKAK